MKKKGSEPKRKASDADEDEEKEEVSPSNYHSSLCLTTKHYCRKMKGSRSTSPPTAGSS